jgi:hypothetical protein
MLSLAYMPDQFFAAPMQQDCGFRGAPWIGAADLEHAQKYIRDLSYQTITIDRMAQPQSVGTPESALFTSGKLRGRA